MKIVYMIRRKADGLFSQGGVHPRFSKKGKRWAMGGLKNHINLVRGNQYNGRRLGELPYSNHEHELVAIELLEREAGTVELDKVLREMGRARVAAHL